MSSMVLLECVHDASCFELCWRVSLSMEDRRRGFLNRPNITRTSDNTCSISEKLSHSKLPLFRRNVRTTAACFCSTMKRNDSLPRFRLVMMYRIAAHARYHMRSPPKTLCTFGSAIYNSPSLVVIFSVLLRSYIPLSHLSSAHSFTMTFQNGIICFSLRARRLSC